MTNKTSFSFLGMIPSPPPRSTTRFHTQNLTEMARIHRLGRAYSHEGVIESSLGEIEVYYPDGKCRLFNQDISDRTNFFIILDDEETQVSAV
jgi:hypothetical protein